MPRVLSTPTLFVYFVAAAMLYAPVYGQDNWACGSTTGVRVSNYEGYSPISWPYGIAPDEQGGLYVAWEEYTGGPNDRSRIQHLSPEGHRLWGDIGQAIYEGPRVKYPRLVPDGEGGVFAVVRGPDVLARIHHFDAEGNRRWGAQGVIGARACRSISSPYFMPVLSDGQGGLFILYTSSLGAFTEALVVHRISADGEPLWGKECGVVAATDLSIFHGPGVADGQGGLVLSFGDFTSDPSYIHVKAQHIDADGQMLWGPNGILVANGPGHKFPHPPIPDGEGGFLILWYQRGVPTDSVWGQRIDANGQGLWTPNGERISPDGYLLASSMSDGEGGAWVSVRSPDGFRVQRITGDNQPVLPDYILVSTGGRNPGARLLPDAQGGAYAFWQDARGIYYQQITGDGQMQQPIGGAPLTTVPAIRGQVITQTVDRAGHLFVAWDYYNGVGAARAPCAADPQDP